MVTDRIKQAARGGALCRKSIALGPNVSWEPHSMLKGFITLSKKGRNELAMRGRRYARHIFACVDDKSRFSQWSFDQRQICD